jgi:hypothetical protein
VRCEKSGQYGSAREIWFGELVTIMLTMICRVEMKPGPQVEQTKTDQIFSHVKIHVKKKKDKGIQQLLEMH